MLAKNGDQSRFIDDGASRRIDQHRRRLHARELSVSNHTARLVIQRQMDGDKVCPGEKVV